jgi:hypothetical protein
MESGEFVMITFPDNASCKICKNWKPKESRYDKSIIYGECAKSSGCFCCNKNLEFGGNGGGIFQSEETFLCKFWEKKTSLDLTHRK